MMLTQLAMIVLFIFLLAVITGIIVWLTSGDEERNEPPMETEFDTAIKGLIAIIIAALLIGIIVPVAILWNSFSGLLILVVLAVVLAAFFVIGVAGVTLILLTAFRKQKQEQVREKEEQRKQEEALIREQRDWQTALISEIHENEAKNRELEEKLAEEQRERDLALSRDQRKREEVLAEEQRSWQAALIAEIRENEAKNRELEERLAEEQREREEAFAEEHSDWQAALIAEIRINEAKNRELEEELANEQREQDLAIARDQREREEALAEEQHDWQTTLIAEIRKSETKNQEREEMRHEREEALIKGIRDWQEKQREWEENQLNLEEVRAEEQRAQEEAEAEKKRRQEAEQDLLKKLRLKNLYRQLNSHYHDNNLFGLPPEKTANPHFIYEYVKEFLAFHELVYTTLEQTDVRLLDRFQAEFAEEFKVCTYLLRFENLKLETFYASVLDYYPIFQDDLAERMLESESKEEDVPIEEQKVYSALQVLWVIEAHVSQKIPVFMEEVQQVIQGMENRNR